MCYISKMKLLVQLLLLMAINICSAQSPYRRISTYSLNKYYDTISHTEQLFNSNGRLVNETQIGKEYKDKQTRYSHSSDGSTSIGLTIYKNGDSTWLWHNYTSNRLTTLRNTTYNASKQQWEDTLITTYTYNDAGNIIEELIWHKKNVFGDVILNTWNINRIIYSYDNIGKLLGKKTYYIYSLNDWDVELLKNKADRLEDTIKLTSTTYNYTPKGYTRINYNINNIDLYDTTYIKYEFDKFNRVIKESEKTKSILSGNIIRTYSYHPEKRIDREIYYNAADKLQRVKIYVYE